MVSFTDLFTNLGQMPHLVLFSVLAIWYCSTSRLVLECQIATNAFEGYLLFSVDIVDVVDGCVHAADRLLLGAR